MLESAAFQLQPKLSSEMERGMITMYDRRDWVASALTLMAGGMLFVLQGMLVIRTAEKISKPIQINLASAPVSEPVVPVPEVIPSPIKPVPVTDTKPTPREVTPTNQAAPAQLPVEPVAIPKPVAAAPVSNAVSEGAFATDVRNKIERKKIYPDIARDLGMTGEVEVLYELDRSGNLLRAEIVSSSGYKLLDQAAIKAVKSASYKSFPEDAWLGVSSKVFRTKLVFSINQ